MQLSSTSRREPETTHIEGYLIDRELFNVGAGLRRLSVCSKDDRPFYSEQTTITKMVHFIIQIVNGQAMSGFRFKLDTLYN